MSSDSPVIPDETLSQNRLSKDERKKLLAQIERGTIRPDPPERLLQRAEQALTSGDRNQAGRLLQQLKTETPALPGLAALEERLNAMLKQDKQLANIRKAEEMLVRYIQERKKPMADLALQTLLDIAPDHPRRGEYEIWVRDLDEEVAFHREADELLAAGRAALQRSDLEEAKIQLAKLQKLDADAQATNQLAAEIAHIERGRAASADIERGKQQVEELLAAGRTEEAERALEVLAQHDIPKITLDFLRKRIEEAQAHRQRGATMAAFEADFRKRIEAEDWQGARDVAHRFGELFKDAKAADMFNEVSRREAEHRRKHSLRQGLETLEQFLAQGKKNEAQLALKLLRSQGLDEAQAAQFEQRVNAL